MTDTLNLHGELERCGVKGVDILLLLWSTMTHPNELLTFYFVHKKGFEMSEVDENLRPCRWSTLGRKVGELPC